MKTRFLSLLLLRYYLWQCGDSWPAKPQISPGIAFTCVPWPYFASCPVLDVTLFPSFSSHNIIFFLFFSFPSIVYYQSSTFLERSCSPSSYFAASPNSMASNDSTTPVTLSIRQSKDNLLQHWESSIFGPATYRFFHGGTCFM